MKRLYLGLIALAIVMCLVFGFLFIKDTFFSANTSAVSTSATPDDPMWRGSISKEITVPLNSSAVLSLSKSDELYVKRWKSDNEDIVTVDSGGRIDALKKGTAAVTASFTDGAIYTYHITVEDAQAEAKADVFSTCLTANADVLEKNKKSDSEKNLYEIQVNRLQNCVTVYTYDEKGAYTVPVRAMVCSCGKNNSTILGEFEIYFKGEWHALYNNVYGQWVSGFSGDFLFHSVPYKHSFENDSLKTDEFNKLGTPASLGCVRLAAGDSKWIFENCPVGTKVKVFDSEEEMPLGKPEAIKITDTKCGWDPTDSKSGNPYNKKFPEIKGAADVAVSAYGVYSMTDGVKAYDSCGNDITDKLEVTGNVVMSRSGEYKVTYKVTDALKRTTEQTITVTVR